jgi:hypothetical protein
MPFYYTGKAFIDKAQPRGYDYLEPQLIKIKK